MNWFQKLPGFERSAPGLERKILRELPRATIAGTVIPAFCYLYAVAFPSPELGQSVERHLADVGILMVSVVITIWTAIFTLAIGCFIVTVMKGPAYVADRYPLQDSEEPAKDRSERNQNGG